jgi:hypothetical protein
LDPDCDSGSAYVYVRSGTTWTPQQKLTAGADAAALDEFGVSVSVSGDTAVVGAYANDDAGSLSGSAYVFLRAGAVWTEQQKLTASDAAASDQFGISVSVSGDTAVVGAHGNDDTGSASGSAYVFTRSGTVWTQQPKLTASDAAAGDEFGLSVSVSGDTAVVGAWRDDGAGNDAGAAYVFVSSGGVWGQQKKLTASDAAADNYFGNSVSVSGDTVLVGAQTDDGVGVDSGSAYVFDCTPVAPPPEIVWDPATSPGPWPNNNPDATTRSLRFRVQLPPSDTVSSPSHTVYGVEYSPIHTTSVRL